MASYCVFAHVQPSVTQAPLQLFLSSDFLAFARSYLCNGQLPLKQHDRNLPTLIFSTWSAFLEMSARISTGATPFFSITDLITTAHSNSCNICSMAFTSQIVRKKWSSNFCFSIRCALKTTCHTISPRHLHCMPHRVFVVCIGLEPFDLRSCII